MITPETKIMAGIILLSITTIEFGGYFLLTVLSGKRQSQEFTDFQKAMFRAGHAHAGVLTILALVAQILIDLVSVSSAISWAMRVGYLLAALLMSGGFFAAALHQGATKPNKNISILYAGVVVLAISLMGLGILLLINS
jgi:Ni,Fe-hydrogenase I cytochrome b subunit